MSYRHLDQLVRSLVAILYCLALSVPILFINSLEPTQHDFRRTFIIYTSTLIFSVFLSSCLMVKRWEIFVAIAAYYTILAIPLVERQK